MPSLTSTDVTADNRKAAKMNPEIRDQWADALESGEYPQCQGALTKVDPVTYAESNCCLGVLTELAVKAGVIERIRTDPNRNRIVYSGNEAMTLTPEVQAWADLEDDNPTVDYDGTRTWSLAELNDGMHGGHPLTFPEIAKLIRTQF